jgi:hypothetical protein
MYHLVSDAAYRISGATYKLPTAPRQSPYPPGPSPKPEVPKPLTSDRLMDDSDGDSIAELASETSVPLFPSVICANLHPDS